MEKAHMILANNYERIIHHPKQA